MHPSITSPRILLRALLAAGALPLAGCYADGGLAMEATGDTEASATAAATGTTGPDTPTTSAGDSATTGDNTTGEPVDCYSTRDFFADRVWAPLMATNCAMCHEPTGVAAEKGAKFRLLTAVYPGFIEANVENIKSLKGYEYEGTPLLLAKPTGLVDHGGGVVLDPESELYADFVELLAQLEEPVECPVTPPSAAFPDVQLLTPEQTLRKAALHLVGRLPTAEERAAVADGGEAALRDALDVFMTEDTFYERLAEMYNDVIFTDTYLSRDGVGTLNATTPDWPNVLKYFDKVNPLPDDQKARIKRAVSREPLALIQYVVRNNLPFTDVLLAPYTVFTPDSAWLYGVDLKFDDPNDANELKPGTLKVTRNGKELSFPHAGVLTSPMWLNRFPTTPTNRNRHRSRKVYDQFLATDVLALASQAIDPAAGSAFANPTRDASECAKCHRVIDPIAGAFQAFDKNNQEGLLDPPVWYPEMFAPGYGNELMPTDEFKTGLQWLAKRVTADPRFSLATTYTVYRALTGQKPIPYPTDNQNPDFKQLQAAWELQDEALRAIASEFIASNYDLKLIVREVVLSPYYRGDNMGRAPTDTRKAELVAVGTGRLSTPELLSRKIQAIAGVRWGGTSTDLLQGDYKILYGGIDSFDVTQRLGDINQIMAAVATRMALEVACTATTFDFTKPAEERLLFPMVDTADTPEINEDAIRNNIAYLHDRILGDTVGPNDAAVNASYKLFADTYAAGVQAMLDKTESNSLGSCQALKDPTTNTDLPAERQIKTDDTYAIRAWQAVVIYLLSDYKFLYE
jgi:hypothetical protein